MEALLLQGLLSCRQPQLWKFHTVVWQTTSKHCTKKRAAREPRLFFFIQLITYWFVALSLTLPSSNLKVMLHAPIFNADFNPCYTRQLLTQFCYGNGMLHETIFNATLLATLESKLLLDKYGGQRVKKTAAENHSGSVVSGRFGRTTQVSSPVLHLQQAPPSCLFTSRQRDLLSVLRGAFWGDVALKVSGGGVTRTNTIKIRATMLQIFESLSKTCNMLPQQNVALKSPFTPCYTKQLLTQQCCVKKSALKIGLCNITFTISSGLLKF